MGWWQLLSVPFPSSTICLGEKRYPISLRDVQWSQVSRKVTPVLGGGGGGALSPWPGKLPILLRPMWYLKHLRASLEAQTVKNLPAKGETWVGKIPWRRKWLPIPVFLPGESHRQRSLAGYIPWDCKVGHNQATNTNYSTLVDQTCLSVSSKWKEFFQNFKCVQIFSCTLNSQFVASLVAQMVKSLPAAWETRVRSLGQEDPLEKEMATHSSILGWKIP